VTISDPFEAITVGQEAELVHVVSEADLDTFARLTGDNNPLHMDEDFASSTTFKKRVVHGMLTASFISTIIGTRLPGPGSLWYEQHLRFLHAVRIGERIRVWAKVTQKSPGQRVLTLDTIVFGEGDRRVIEGEAKVRMLEVQTEEATAQVRAQGAVIVSGASRGIGAAVARELGLAGFPVIVNYSRSEAPANEIVREIVAAGGRATAYRASVTDRATVDQMVAAAHGEYGALAGVVNNAAPEMRFADFADLAWEDIQQQIDVQIRGAFNLCQAAAPADRGRRRRDGQHHQHHHRQCAAAEAVALQHGQVGAGLADPLAGRRAGPQGDSSQQRVRIFSISLAFSGISRIRSVSVIPGDTLLTRIPLGPSSTASERVSEASADLAML